MKCRLQVLKYRSKTTKAAMDCWRRPKEYRVLGKSLLLCWWSWRSNTFPVPYKLSQRLAIQLSTTYNEFVNFTTSNLFIALPWMLSCEYQLTVASRRVEELFPGKAFEFQFFNVLAKPVCLQKRVIITWLDTTCMRSTLTNLIRWNNLI